MEIGEHDNSKENYEKEVCSNCCPPSVNHIGHKMVFAI